MLNRNLLPTHAPAMRSHRLSQMSTQCTTSSRGRYVLRCLPSTGSTVMVPMFCTQQPDSRSTAAARTRSHDCFLFASDTPAQMHKVMLHYHRCSCMWQSGGCWCTFLHIQSACCKATALAASHRQQSHHPDSKQAAPTCVNTVVVPWSSSLPSICTMCSRFQQVGAAKRAMREPFCMSAAPVVVRGRSLL